VRKKQKKDEGRNQGLKMMNFHVPPELYRRFKLKVLRERVTVHSITTSQSPEKSCPKSFIRFF